MLSARFHNIILAVMLKKKVIAQSYNGKFESLMANLGLSEYCQPLEVLDMDKLLDSVITVEKESERPGRIVEKKTAEYRRVLDEQYQKVLTGPTREAGNTARLSRGEAVF